MRKAFFPGSFDPFNLAHLAVVCEALKDYDQVIIGVGNDLTKIHRFSIDERLEMVEKSIEDLVDIVTFYRGHGNVFSARMRAAASTIKENPDCVKVVPYHGTAIDFAIKNGAESLIIGVKNILDKREEYHKRHLNDKICALRGGTCSTICLSVSMVSHISSSLIRLLMVAGEYIIAKEYVMPSVHDIMCRVCLRDVYYEVTKGVSSDYDSLCEKLKSDFQRFTAIACNLNMLNIYRMHNCSSHDMSSKVYDLAIFWNSLVIDGKVDDKTCKLLAANVDDVNRFVELCNATRYPVASDSSKDTDVLSDICLNSFAYKENTLIDLWKRWKIAERDSYNELTFLLRFKKICDRHSTDLQIFRTEFFKEKYRQVTISKMKLMAGVIEQLLKKYDK